MSLKVYARGNSSKLFGQFNTRKEAVYYCKVNQTLPLPDYKWDDQFEIVECGVTL